MSKPKAGTYYIVNRVNSPIGEKLAITYNGEGKAATVTPLTNADSQKVKIMSLPNFRRILPRLYVQWSINDYDGKNQSFSPVTAENLQAGIVSSVITIVPADALVFFTTVGSNGLSYVHFYFVFGFEGIYQTIICSQYPGW